MQVKKCTKKNIKERPSEADKGGKERRRMAGIAREWRKMAGNWLFRATRNEWTGIQDTTPVATSDRIKKLGWNEDFNTVSFQRIGKWIPCVRESGSGLI